MDNTAAFIEVVQGSGLGDGLTININFPYSGVQDIDGDVNFVQIGDIGDPIPDHGGAEVGDVVNIDTTDGTPGDVQLEDGHGEGAGSADSEPGEDAGRDAGSDAKDAGEKAGSQDSETGDKGDDDSTPDSGEESETEDAKPDQSDEPEEKTDKAGSEQTPEKAEETDPSPGSDQTPEKAEEADPNVGMDQSPEDESIKKADEPKLGEKIDSWFQGLGDTDWGSSETTTDTGETETVNA